MRAGKGVIMGPPSSIVAEIDTTPFKSTDDSTNGTKGFKYSFAVYPKYQPPLDTRHAATPTDQLEGLHYVPEGGNTGLIEFRVATTVSWDAAVSRWSDAPPWNTTSPWNLSLGEPTHNLTLSEEEGGSGWWGDGQGHEAGEWSPGLLAITGLALYTLALCTAVGNALVIHAIRTEKRLQTVGCKSSYVVFVCRQRDSGGKGRSSVVRGREGGRKIEMERGREGKSERKEMKR